MIFGWLGELRVIDIVMLLAIALLCYDSIRYTRKVRHLESQIESQIKTIVGNKGDDK